MAKYDTETFIEKAKNIHGNKYDYSLVKYVNNCTKVKIICKIHGEFQQIPSGHIIKRCGCKNCSVISISLKRKSNTEEFIGKSVQVHGDKYDYSKVKYDGRFNDVIIICFTHGDFFQTPRNHLYGQGCPKCWFNRMSVMHKSNTIEFIEKCVQIHKNKYDYSKVEYDGRSKKIIIICKIHGIFEQSPGAHLQGSGCPFCINKTEGILYTKLLEDYPDITTQFKAEWCRNKNLLPFDCCIPSKKIIIELDGEQHFKQVKSWRTPKEQQRIDIYKMECANSNGYSVIRLLQNDVFKNKYDWNTNLLLNIENISKSGAVVNIFMCRNNEYQPYKKANNPFFII